MNDKIDKIFSNSLVRSFLISLLLIYLLNKAVYIPNENDALIYFLIIFVCVCLLSQKWFWFVLLGLSCVASFFAMIASVIHFQILGATGYFVLFCILCFMVTTLWGVFYDNSTY